jgi:hypothetical protein
LFSSRIFILLVLIFATWGVAQVAVETKGSNSLPYGSSHDRPWSERIVAAFAGVVIILWNHGVSILKPNFIGDVLPASGVAGPISGIPSRHEPWRSRWC